MNDPVRKLAVVAMVMFIALMGAASFIQVVEAPTLNSDARNVRTLYSEFGNFRGPIVVEGSPVAFSVEVNDPYNYQRTYSNGELYASATGYYSIVFGRTGLESTEDELLSGTSDALFWTRLGNLLTGEQQRGASLELTLRSRLQQVAAEQLGDRAGSVVALDPSTGAILAMVTSPSYDPTVLASHDTAEVNAAWTELLEDPAGPLINRAIGGDTYPPGSTFKVVMSAAALENGYSADTEVYAPTELELPGTTTTLPNYLGRSCTDASDMMTLADALRISCNTAFGQLGMDLGWDAVTETAEEFGFTDTLEIPLTVTASRLGENLDDAQVAMSSIGQFDVRVTPLQMAMVAAGVANDGKVMTPYLVDTVRASDLSLVQRTEPELYGTPLSPANAEELTQMMVGVVADGTGRTAQIPGVTVAGKTGTAETGDDTAPHTWFISFAPAEDPVIAVAVVVDNGGDIENPSVGSVVAAPIAKAVIEEALAMAEEGQL